MTSTAELTSPASANTPLIGVRDHDYTLEHKYTRTDGRIYLSGVQALVRLPLMQRLRDQAAAGMRHDRPQIPEDDFKPTYDKTTGDASCHSTSARP